MPLNAKEAAGGGSNFTRKIVDVGSYPGCVVQIIDLGLQAQRAFQGKEKPPVREILVTYEFLDEFLEDEDGNELPDKPLWISESFGLFNLSSDRAKSTIRYKSLDPKDHYEGDWSKLLGILCNISVVQNPNKKNPDQPYMNVGGVSLMREKDVDKAPDPVNTPMIFDLDAPDMEVWNSLQPWVQKRIKEGLEFNGSDLQVAIGEERVEDHTSRTDLDDEIPY